MKQITESQWAGIPSDYKGKWTKGIYDFRGGDFPKEWIGRRTMLDYNLTTGGTVLLTEGVSFEIVPDDMSVS